MTKKPNIPSKYSKFVFVINNRPLTFEELCKLAESEIKEWKKFLKDIKKYEQTNKIQSKRKRIN